MIFTPTPSTRYEVVLPRPKFAHRLSRTEDCETWAYLGGQLGGGSFAVRRDGGMADKLTLRDFRIYFGWEQVRRGGGGLFAELGYVFNRTIEYANFDEEYEFDDALMLRLGLRM